MASMDGPFDVIVACGTSLSLTISVTFAARVSHEKQGNIAQ